MPRDNTYQPRGSENAAAKLDDHDVWLMRWLHHVEGVSIVECARKFEVNPETARKAIQGKTWKHVWMPTAQPKTA